MSAPIAFAILITTSLASAQSAPGTGAQARVVLYQDNDATTVVTSAVAVNATVADTVVIRAGYAVDVVTTASVDVIASATSRWDERRHEFRGGADVYLDDLVLSAGYVHSFENDYRSHRISGGGAMSFAQDNTTLSLGLVLILSEVGRAGDARFSEDQRSYGVNLGVTQSLSANVLGALGYSLQKVDGFQASPYRYVSSGTGERVSERHPDERTRHALTGRLRWAVADDWVLSLDERIYYDSWSVFGTTTDLRLIWEVSPVVDIEIRDRFHYQTAAYFFDPAYEQQVQFMSLDRELSTFFDIYVGPSISFHASDVGPFGRLTFNIRADYFFYKFENHPYLNHRFGTLISLGVGAEL